MQGDRWDSGAAYQTFMGRWSRRLAPIFVRWVGVDEGGCWLDVGSGTGALVEGILAEASPRRIVACDASAPYVEAARGRIDDPRVEFVVADADDALPRDPEGYDVAISSLALNFFPDPRRTVMDQKDRVRRGGVVAACVWDYKEGMEFLRYFWDAARRISSRAEDLDEGEQFSICDPEAMRELWESAGLEEIRVEPLTMSTTFSGFDDFWGPFHGGPGPAPGFVSSLSDREREALAVELRASLPFAEDGSIPLEARAWAVAGMRSDR